MTCWTLTKITGHTPIQMTYRTHTLNLFACLLHIIFITIYAFNFSFCFSSKSILCVLPFRVQQCKDISGIKQIKSTSSSSPSLSPLLLLSSSSPSWLSSSLWLLLLLLSISFTSNIPLLLLLLHIEIAVLTCMGHLFRMDRSGHCTNERQRAVNIF